MRQETIDALGDDLIQSASQEEEKAEAELVEDRRDNWIMSPIWTQI